jgi:hypothetical protein
LLLFLPANASAYSKGMIAGTVEGAAGPVAGARVLPVNGNSWPEAAITDSAGHYQLEVWPGTYGVGVYPADESADDFKGASGIVVAEAATTTVNIQLPPAGGSAHMSGVATYGDNAPDAGVEIIVTPQRYELDVPVRSLTAITDESGAWDVGNLHAGIYQVSYSVVTGGGISAPDRTMLTTETILLESSEDRRITKLLNGPRPLALVRGRVINAEGWGGREARVEVSPAGGGGSLGSVEVDEVGYFQFSVPTGGYDLTASGGEQEDDGTGTAAIEVNNGRISSPEVHLSALPVTPGAVAHREQQLLDWLNAQRSQWGLPAGLQAVPVWSQACAAHDAYGAKNGVLDHPEIPTLPEHSVGGQWAGEHAVLAAGGAWGPEVNPWMDAPIHLNQLFTPDLSAIGLDETNGYQCATTWPGMLRPRPARGTIYTFPADGSSGLPPVELAGESPETPNHAVGIPDLAGRQLFVYETGTETFRDGFGRAHISGASLTGADGSSVPVRWLDQQSSLGGYLTGAIILPVEPLRPFTTYSATVSLAAVSDPSETDPFPSIPAQTYSWSFTTGRNNPGGIWDEGKLKQVKVGPGRKAVARWRHHQIIVKGWRFTQGHVIIKRKVLLKSKRRLDGKVMARARVNAAGRFVAHFRWPERRHIALRISQGGKSTSAIYTPPHPPGWYRRHRHHH